MSSTVSKGLVGWADNSKAFLAEVQAEFKKVAWPSQKEVIGGTISVVVVVAIMAVALGFVDYGLSAIVSRILP